MASSGTAAWIVACVATLSACQEGSRAEVSAAPSTTLPEECAGWADLPEATSPRKLAVIVGASAPAGTSARMRTTPAADARAVHAWLSTREDSGPQESLLCLLTDEQANMQNLEELFERVLLRATRVGGNDELLLYLSAYGTQRWDDTADEPDERDEALVLTDGSLLLDDTLDRYVRTLEPRTRQIEVVIDSCSAPLVRTPSMGADEAVSEDADSDGPGSAEPRCLDLGPDESFAVDATSKGDGAGWIGTDLPGVVIASASSPSRVALSVREPAHGLFTLAWIRASRQVGSDTPWEQLARTIDREVATLSGGAQRPQFEGAISEPSAWTTGASERRGTWSVVDTSPLTLRGPPLAEASPGAEFRLYAAGTDSSRLGDPARAMATARVIEYDGLDAIVEVVDNLDPRPTQPGDLAVPSLAGDAALKLSVDVYAANVAGGVPTDVRTALVGAVSGDPRLSRRIRFERSANAFTVESRSNGGLLLRGPEGAIRNIFSKSDESTVRELAESLANHASQRALLLLRGETGELFENDRTLEVQIARGESQPLCAGSAWTQSCPNDTQIIPLCTQWKIRVKNTSTRVLHVGGAVLWNDGEIEAVPEGGRSQPIEPGGTVVLDGAAFQSLPPLDSQDHVVIFGTQQPTDWNAVATTPRAKTRALSEASDLAAVLRGYVVGERGGRRMGQDQPTSERPGPEIRSWTHSHVPIRVVANAQFVQQTTHQLRCDPGVAQREYTVDDFDLRPYLPGDSESPLFKLLTTADSLARYAKTDGVRYRQHDWTRPSDAENLSMGIDCSRSVWYAFTRAGLPYNREDRYLYTGVMVGASTWMQDEFDSCLGEPLRTGDVLVYRGVNSKGQPTGHTVIVIDPDERVAWGSHGWDGNVSKGLASEADTGVEYQRIAFKPDWDRWDTSRVKLAACWRHRAFDKRSAPQDVEITASLLDDPCSETSCSSGIARSRAALPPVAGAAP